MENFVNQSTGIDVLIDSILHDEQNQSVILPTDHNNVGTDFDFVNSSLTNEDNPTLPTILLDINESQPKVDPLSCNHVPMTPMPASCSCTIFQCKDKMKNLRDEHRLALQRKNYCLKRQEKVIDHYKIQTGNVSPPLQAIQMSQITLPYNLPATQKAMLILNVNDNWKSMYELTYVIRQDHTDEDYTMACLCHRHQCQRKFKMLQASQRRTMEHKNQKIVQNEKLLEFFESSY